jgi:hypothetical protein
VLLDDIKFNQKLFRGLTATVCCVNCEKSDPDGKHRLRMSLVHETHDDSFQLLRF